MCMLGHAYVQTSTTSRLAVLCSLVVGAVCAGRGRRLQQPHPQVSVLACSRSGTLFALCVPARDTAVVVRYVIFHFAHLVMHRPFLAQYRVVPVYYTAVSTCTFPMLFGWLGVIRCANHHHYYQLFIIAYGSLRGLRIGGAFLGLPLC